MRTNIIAICFADLNRIVCGQAGGLLDVVNLQGNQSSVIAQKGLKNTEITCISRAGGLSEVMIGCDNGLIRASVDSETNQIRMEERNPDFTQKYVVAV